MAWLIGIVCGRVTVVFGHEHLRRIAVQLGPCSLKGTLACFSCRPFRGRNVSHRRMPIVRAESHHRCSVAADRWITHTALAPSRAPGDTAFTRGSPSRQTFESIAPLAQLLEFFHQVNVHAAVLASPVVDSGRRDMQLDSDLVAVLTGCGPFVRLPELCTRCLRLSGACVLPWINRPSMPSPGQSGLSIDSDRFTGNMPAA